MHTQTFNPLTEMPQPALSAPAMASTALAQITHYLETPRLFLRPVKVTDLAGYRELLQDPNVMRFIGLKAGEIPTEDEVTDILQKAVNAWTLRGYGRWSVFHKDSGDFLGYCGFRSEQGEPELICLLHEGFWDNGFATEAAAGCLEYGFKSFGFQQVKAFTRPENQRACRAMEKLGAKFVDNIDFYGVRAAVYLLQADSDKK